MHDSESQSGRDEEGWGHRLPEDIQNSAAGTKNNHKHLTV